MDHYDRCHCIDYRKNLCPATCYRAQLTEDLEKISRSRPEKTLITTWAHLGETDECPLNKS